MGLTGSLITPQEAAAAYRREHQEVSAQIVFFSASNYVSQVAVTPAAVAQFYTNYLAQYRLPDRVQVSYVAFEPTNYLAAAGTKTRPRPNLDEQVKELFRQNGMDAVPGAKTPEEAKVKIRDYFDPQTGVGRRARNEANDFATAVFTI